MLTYLHGMSHQGYDLRACYQTGPAHNLLFDHKLDDTCPMFCMFPQLPPGWRWDTPGAGRIVNDLTRALCDRYPQIDRTRLYLTGNSMGGKGTWITAEDAPELYAAVVPISAVDVRPEQARTLLADLPYLHLACGSDDGGFTAGTHRMYDALKPVLGDRISLDVFNHEGHGVWEHFYSKPDFYTALLKYHR
jgi:predicted peptidase